MALRSAAYASFPIDWFLFHPGSNYVADPRPGKPSAPGADGDRPDAGRAGMAAYLALGQALFGCGAGRSLTVIAAPADEPPVRRQRLLPDHAGRRPADPDRPLVLRPLPADLVELPAGARSLADEVRGSRPDFLYISHLHHDHLHAESLADFDRATPVIVGAMNTPNLKTALAALGFRNLIETPFETRRPLADADAELVLFKDFHGNTWATTAQVDYDLDTSLYLWDGDGTRLFLAVDNTILPATRRGSPRRGAPDIASCPTPRPRSSPWRWPTTTAAGSPPRPRLRARTAANFRELTRALGPKRVIPAGGEYVLGGRPRPVALPAAAAGRGAGRRAGGGRPGRRAGQALSRRRARQRHVAVDRRPDADFRDFTDADRAAYALTLANRAPSSPSRAAGRTSPSTGPGAEEVRRQLRRSAREDGGSRSPWTSIWMSAADGGRRLLFRYALDSADTGFCDAEGRAPG